MQTQPLNVCFQAHQDLVGCACALLRRIDPRDDAADLMRLAASCIELGARRALATRDAHEAIRSWRECALGERQLRSATYWALRRGELENRDYDAVFRRASSASRAREAEIERLTRQLARNWLY